MRGTTKLTLIAVAFLTGLMAGPASAEPPSANPNLPKTPFQSFKNAEGGIVTLFGPAPATTRLAVTSLTLDGGHPEFGTQVFLVITQATPASRGVPASCTNNTIDTIYAPVSTRQNRPVHLAFPVPLVLPAENPGGMWCFKASPVGSNQVLILTVGYVVD